MSISIKEFAVLIYASVSIFLTGYQMGDAFCGVEAKHYRSFLLSLFVYPIIIIPVYIADFLLVIFSKIDGIFQITFFFEYLFTKKYQNLNKKQLSNVQSQAGQSLIKDFCIKIINKRNNYKIIKK